MHTITINDPKVSYKVNSKGEHEFSVSLVSLIDNYIEHGIDDNGTLFYLLYNKETNNTVTVTLTESETTERVYHNIEVPNRIIKLRVI